MSDYSPHASEIKSLEIEEANWDSLPPEILSDILLRLPIKSVLTCTSVSKSWNSLIKSPHFISTHLNHTIHSYNQNQTHHLIFRTFDRYGWDYGDSIGDREYYWLYWDNEAGDEYTSFEFPFHGLSSYASSIRCTCNGLVCLATTDNFFIWNPCIRKYITLPLPIPNIVRDPYIGVCIGFGFHSKTNDYKVVRLVSRVDKRHRVECTPKVDVYSLATGKWKMVTAVPPTCAIRRHGRPAFVNGALHWLVLRSTNDGFHNFVLGFDLGDEDFREIMLPKDLLIKDDSCRLTVSVCGESLAAFHNVSGVSCFHVWVMKEYGVLESWTKMLTVGPQGPGVDVWRICDFLIDKKKVLAPVGFRKSGEVVIRMEGGELFSIDIESKRSKDLRIPTASYSSFHPYEKILESLVLLNKRSKDTFSY